MIMSDVLITYILPFRIDYLHGNYWVGTQTGNDNCTDPKILFENAIYQPSDFTNHITIVTYEQNDEGNDTFRYRLDNINEIFKPLNFDYNPYAEQISTNTEVPYVGFCYELEVPKKMQSLGIRIIEGDFRQSLLGQMGQIKIGAPGYFYQNSNVKKRRLSWTTFVSFELEYEINNFLKIGNEFCNPDPSYNRDECVIEQLLKVRCNSF